MRRREGGKREEGSPQPLEAEGRAEEGGRQHLEEEAGVRAAERHSEHALRCAQQAQGPRDGLQCRVLR